MTIPDHLSHLPVWHELPVPFTVMWIDGVPDFRIVDHEKKHRCVMERLCAICGKRMYTFWFVGGPLSLEESNLFMDPAQHEQCARYAIQTCPFLNGTRTKSNTAQPIPPEAGRDPHITPE